MGQEPDRTDPGQLVLQPRDVRFDWSELPLTWIPGELVCVSRAAERERLVLDL